MLGVRQELQVSYDKAYVIFLSKPTVSYHQTITNEAEVIQLLRQRYGSRLKIYEGNRTLEDTIQMFSGARMVIGTYGSKLSTIQLCTKDAVIIEYTAMTSDGQVTPRHQQHYFIWKLADALELRYYRIIENPVDATGKIYVNLSKLTNLLDDIDYEHNVLPEYLNVFIG